jgi:hypothetical protein
MSEIDGVFARCPYCGQFVPADVESRTRVWLPRHAEEPGHPFTPCAGSGELLKIKGAE